MTRDPEASITPTARQSAWIERVGQKAAALATAGKLEFTPLGVIDRAKLAFNPAFTPLVQRAIHEACLDVGRETQSLKPYVYRGDSTSPYESLTVRVTEFDGVPGLSVVEEGNPIPGHHGFLAVDVYPPQD
jgi:hypothetical protein